MMKSECLPDPNQLSESTSHFLLQITDIMIFN